MKANNQNIEFLLAILGINKEKEFIENDKGVFQLMLIIAALIAFTLIILLITTTIYYFEEILSFLWYIMTISTEWIDSLPPFLSLFIKIFMLAFFIIAFLVLLAYNLTRRTY